MKPIQLYLWTQCGACVQQKKIISSLRGDVYDLFLHEVEVVNVRDPNKYPVIRAYPSWVVRGKISAGVKTANEIESLLG